MANKLPVETHHHMVPVMTYVKTISALLVLMLLTVFVAEHPFGSTLVNQGVALLIAVTKATLVVLIFMGVRWSTQLTKFWAMIGFTWLTFFTILFGDYGMRRFEPVQGWEKQPESSLPRVITGPHDPLPPQNSLNVRPRHIGGVQD